MHPEPCGDVTLRRLGKGEAGQSLAVAKGHGLQDMPARPETQMRLLRGGKPRGGRARPAAVAALGDGARVKMGRARFAQKGYDLRLRVEREAAAPAQPGVAAKIDGERSGLRGQIDRDAARRAVARRDGAVEIEVADLVRHFDALRGHGLRDQLDESRAGQKGLPVGGAVIVEDPVIGRDLPFVAARAIGPGQGMGQKCSLNRGGRAVFARAHAARHGLRGHAGFRPDAPVDRKNPRAASTPGLRHGVEVGVRRHVIDLARRGRRCRGRGEEHKQLERAIGEDRVDHPQARDLGREDRVDRGVALGQKRAVIDAARRVQDTGDGAEGVLGLRAGRAHVFHIADIGLQREHAGAARVHRLDRRDARQEARGGHAGCPDLRPVGARRQRFAPHKDDARADRAHKVVGQRHADAAEAPGDQIGAIALEHRRVSSGQAARGIAAFIPAPLAPGGGAGAGFGQQVFEHRIDMCGGRGLRGPALRQIKRRDAEPREFARAHARRPRDQRLFGIGKPFVAHLRGAGGEDGDRQGEVFLHQCLRQVQQAVETVLKIAVEEARPRAEGLGPGDEPEMPDPVGQGGTVAQRGDQRRDTLDPLFGGERIAVFAQHRESIARHHADHPVPGGAQALRRDLGQPGVVGEEQPGESSFGQPRGVERVCRAGRIGRPPFGPPAPIGDVVAADRGGGVLGRLRLARVDEIAAALEGIGGQADPAAARAAPDLGPVSPDPAGPEARKTGQEPQVIRHGVIGMAQGRHDLSRIDPRIHLCQRAQRPAGADFEKDARRAVRQICQPFGEQHRLPQLLHPVIGIGRLRVAQRTARAVRDHRQARRLQRQALQKGAEVGQDRVQHPRMCGDVDGDALMFDAARGQVRRQPV